MSILFPPQGTGLKNIVDDLSPQLGGDLDTNTYSIDSVTPTELGYVHGVTSAIQDQLDALAGTLIFQGDWNALTNDPDLTTTPPTTGYYWRVSVAGATSLDGIIDWDVGDLAIKTATGWVKVDNTDASITGTTSLTFTLGTSSVLGQIVVSVQTGAADKSLTITNAALTDDRIITFPDATDTVALLDVIQTLTNKTLTTPTIGDLINATHTHADVAGGGQLTSPLINEAVALAATSTTIDGAVSISHTQNTDTGTTNAVFQLESGSFGANIKNLAGELQARVAADDAYADFRANSLYGDGSNLTGVGSATASALTIDATNKTGVSLPKGVVVYVSGASGNKTTIAKASCTDAAKIRVIGITAEVIADNATGIIRVKGELVGIDTSGVTDANPNGEVWAVGDLLWLDDSNGGMSNVRPTSGRSIKCAYSLKGSDNNDTLLVIARENEVWNTCAAGEDIVLRLGDAIGVNKVSIRDYANNEVASIDSDGNAIMTIDGGTL